MYQLPKGVDVADAKNTLVTFAFVRHPFKRLVSLCSDKFKKKKPKECVKTVIATTKGGINQDGDGHLSAQCYQCPFCSIKFDMIGKLDQMGQHTAFLAKTLGIEVGGEYRIACFIVLTQL